MCRSPEGYEEEPLARVRRVVARAERLDRVPVRLPLVLNVARIVALRLVGVFDRSHRVLIVDRSGLEFRVAGK
jgi:hypothetical protein